MDTDFIMLQIKMVRFSTRSVMQQNDQVDQLDKLLEKGKYSYSILKINLISIYKLKLEMICLHVTWNMDFKINK